MYTAALQITSSRAPSTAPSGTTPPRLGSGGSPFASIPVSREGRAGSGASARTTRCKWRRVRCAWVRGSVWHPTTWSMHAYASIVPSALKAIVTTLRSGARTGCRAAVERLAVAPAVDVVGSPTDADDEATDETPDDEAGTLELPSAEPAGSSP